MQAILMAMQMSGCNTACIALCSMSRATLEATWCHHWATTHSVSSQRPPGHQQSKQWQKIHLLCWPFWWPWQCTGTTARIAQWRRSRASLEATGCRHRASIAANSCNRSRICHFFMFTLSTRRKRLRVDMKAPVFNRGMTEEEQYW